MVDRASSELAMALRWLEDAVAQAARALTEGRDAIAGLRASAEVIDPATAIRAFGQEISASNSNPPGFQVAMEALRNAFVHAAARQVTVEIRYDAKYFFGLASAMMARGSILERRARRGTSVCTA